MGSCWYLFSALLLKKNNNSRAELEVELECINTQLHCILTQKLPIHLILQSISSLANVVRRVRTRLAMHLYQASNILCLWNGHEHFQSHHSGGCASLQIYLFSPPKLISQLIIVLQINSTYISWSTSEDLLLLIFHS